MSRIYHSRHIANCLALVLVAALVVLAQVAGAAERLIAFDIAAQPLDTALSAYGAAANVQLFFDAEMTAGLRSTALKGAFTPETALTKLLAGSGLAAHAIDDQGFTLVWAARAGGSAPARDVSQAVLQFNRYSAAIQDAARTALCRHRETAPGSYRALARVWINGTGTVARAELVTSTGEMRRDAVLSTALHNLAVGAAPPAGLPQPVTMLIASGAYPVSYCSEGQPVRRADFGRDAVR